MQEWKTKEFRLWCHSYCFFPREGSYSLATIDSGRGGGSRDPHMMRWFALMACYRGDGPVLGYTAESFDWLGHHIFPIEDFPYDGMDYRGDPDIPLPVKT